LGTLRNTTVDTAGNIRLATRQKSRFHQLVAFGSAHQIG
jgi:hypothetical protein